MSLFFSKTIALASMTSIVMAYKAGQLQKSIDAEIANGTDLSECRKALEQHSVAM
jgi:hypothetical protein